MTSLDIDHLKYPIGKFMRPEVVTDLQIKTWIQEIKDLPGLIATEIEQISDGDFLKVYRPGGWNITQLIHHLADSHMNSFIRFKLSLTEENPSIKPYLEAKWAEMPDDTTLKASVSLDLLTALHHRWGYLLDHMTSTDFNKGFFHPEKKRIVDLNETVALYAWHCRHHLAHIRIAKHS